MVLVRVLVLVRYCRGIIHVRFSFKKKKKREKLPVLSAKQRLHYTLVRSVSDAAAHFIFTPAAFTLQLASPEQLGGDLARAS